MSKTEIVSKTPFVAVGRDGKLASTTFVVYKREDGRVGAVTVDKAEPTLADVDAAIKAREAKK